MRVAKDPGFYAQQASAIAYVLNNLNVQTGQLDLSSLDINVGKNIAVYSGGRLLLPAGSEISMTDQDSITVFNGGKLDLSGSSVNGVGIKGISATNKYHLTIMPGGVIAAQKATFSELGMNGVNIVTGGIIDPAAAFTDCTFTNGTSGGTMLTINNNQVLNISGAIFPTNTWGASSNAKKTVNMGNVNFINFSGDFSGESYDDDVNNLLTWVVPMTISFTASVSNLCLGASTTLNVAVTGGVAPYTYLWSPASSLSSNTVSNPVATPLASTNYFVTITDVMGNSVSGNLMINVGIPPIANAGTDQTISPGGTASLAATVAGGTPPFTYLWSPPTGLSNTSVLNPAASPIATTTYTFLVTDGFGCTSSDDLLITVMPTGSGNINGNITYNNAASSALSLVNVNLKLSGTTIASTSTNGAGYYEFNAVPAGAYTLSFASTTPWGGSNSADALLTLKHFTGMVALTGINLVAADVDNSAFINSIDALIIAKRFTAIITSFTAGDWAFETASLTVTASATTTKNIKAACYGDVNGSYTPPYKSIQNFELVSTSELSIAENDYVEIPFSLTSAAGVGAASLMFNYPSADFEIVGVRFSTDASNGLMNAVDNKIRIAWYSLADQDFSQDKPLFWLRLKLKNETNNLNFSTFGENELSDHLGNPISGVALSYPSLVNGSGQDSKLTAKPNPFTNSTLICFTTNEAAAAEYQIIDSKGQKVLAKNCGMIDAGSHEFTIERASIAMGTYNCTLKISYKDHTEFRSIKLIILE
jgi:hypothetical protein